VSADSQDLFRPFSLLDHRNECLLKDNVTTEAKRKAGKLGTSWGRKDEGKDSGARDQKTSKRHEMSEI